MNSLFEARLLVQLAEHVRLHRGLARLNAPQSVAQAELALARAGTSDVPVEVSVLLQQAVTCWLKGGNPAPYMLQAFWLRHPEQRKLRPVKFRLHIGAPACYQAPGENAFHLTVCRDWKNLRRGGTLEEMRLGDFRGERGGFPDDVVIWWEGDLTGGQIGEIAGLVQPGCTVSLLRPGLKTWWLGWAGLKFEDRLASLLYGQYHFAKIFASGDPECDVVIFGVEGLKK